MRRSHRRRLEVGEAGRDEGGTVKLDVQMSTAGQIDGGCPESGGRLTFLGTVDFCPADPRILRNVGTGREVVLECAVHQDFYTASIYYIMHESKMDWTGAALVVLCPTNVNLERLNL